MLRADAGAEHRCSPAAQAVLHLPQHAVPCQMRPNEIVTWWPGLNPNNPGNYWLCMQACLRIRDGGMADAPSFSGRVSPPELRLARLTSRSHPRKLFSRVLCADSRGTLTTKRTTKQRKPAKKQKEPQDAKGGNAFSQLYWNFTGKPTGTSLRTVFHCCHRAESSVPLNGLFQVFHFPWDR